MFNRFNKGLESTKKQENQINSKKLEIKLNKTDYDFIKKSRTNKESYFLKQYNKYFHKKLSIKYNILPKEYTLMQLENFVKAKYCHLLAKFKEDLLFNYDQEFFKRYYKKEESIKKLPLFSEFYKTYLIFFCYPRLSELNLNEFFEEIVEKKAKAFYQENYKEENEDKKGSKKIINTIFFTNKVRKDISRKNTLTDLSKTTIDFITTTNKNSIRSYISLNNLINEIGNRDNNKNYNNLNKNSITSRQNNNNEKIAKIIKKMETNFNFQINDKLIRKKNNIKNISKNTIPPEKNISNNKKIKDIKVKPFYVKWNNNFSNNSIVNNNADTNPNKNKENNNISKPLYHKINIVNNKIIIINNNRSKDNILKESKEKIKKKNNITELSRNYNNKFFDIYNNITSGVTDLKDRNNTKSNYNTNTFLLKTLKENYNKKVQSSQNYHSIQKNCYTKLKNIKILKEKKLNNNNQKANIRDYNNKRINSNLFVNYLNNFKNINNNISLNTNINLSNKIRKKKLTNYQMFSKNTKNINHTKKFKNISKEKFSPFYKMIHSTCSLGTKNKNKIKNISTISNYNTLESQNKSKTNNRYRKQCSTQEQFKTKLQINTTGLNKNIFTLKLNKK